MYLPRLCRTLIYGLCGLLLSSWVSQLHANEATTVANTDSIEIAASVEAMPSVETLDIAALLNAVLQDDWLLEAPHVRIATGEYLPWSSESLLHYGLVNRIIREAFELQGYSVSFFFLPWKRALEESKAGRYDATSFWYDTPLRRENFLYSEPVSREKTVLFFHKDRPLDTWEHFSDLSHLRVGATIGYSYTPAFWQAVDDGDIKVEVVSNDASNFKKLLHRRIDVFPMGLVAGYELLQTAFPPDLIELLDYHANPVIISDGHVLFPKIHNRSEHLQKIFNRGLQTLREQGLLKRYQDEMIITPHFPKKPAATPKPVPEQQP